MSDYYAILGVTKDSSADEIKKAYKRLANKHHPDKSGGDEGKFKEIKEAYETLSDPTKRQVYDYGGKSAFDQGFKQTWRARPDVHFNAADFNDLFNTFKQAQRPKQQSVRLKMSISLVEAYNGAHKKLNTRTNKHCSDCNGSGIIYNHQTTAVNPCKPCGGIGAIPVHLTPDFFVPAGIATGDQINVHDAKTGEHIIIDVIVAEDDYYEREGNNIIAKVKVPFYKFIVGGTLDFLHIDDRSLSIKIPAKKFNTGDRIRLKGKGMPLKGTPEFGDMYITLEPTIPQDVTDEQYELIEKYVQLNVEPDEVKE